MRTARSLLATLLLGAAVLLPPLAAPEPARAADDGVSEVAATTYELLPDEGLIRVTIDLRLANQAPDRTERYACTTTELVAGYGPVTVQGTCTRTIRSYVNRTELAVEDVARSLRAAVDGKRTRIHAGSPSNGFRVVRVDIPDTFYGQARRVRLSYQVPGGKPRSASWTRAGRAYASFCIVANGRDGGSVRAIVPAGFAVTTSGGRLERVVTPSKIIYRSGTLAEPYDFWACLEGVNPAGYARTDMTASGGPRIALEAWPEDREWASGVASTVRAAVPALERLTGFVLAPRGGITVREMAQQELGDYAGWFDPDTGLIRLTERYDPATVTHELSHAWFNDALFEETWLSEGNAGWVEAASGIAPENACADPGPAPGGSRPELWNWRYLGPRATAQERAVVDFNYAASCWIVTRVVAAIGPVRYRAVLDGADRGIRLYTEADTPDSGAIDWRRWLDLVDILGLDRVGARNPDLVPDLLLEFGVVTDPAELDRRSVARARYADVREAAGDWGLPPAIDRPMADWQFGVATEAMDAAFVVLVARDAARARAGDLRLPVAAVRVAFESALRVDDLDSAAALAARQGEVATEVLAARTTVSAGRDLEVQLGLLGEPDPAGPAVAAVAALEGGDLEEASRRAAETVAAIGAAPERGRSRLTLAATGTAASLSLLLVLTVLAIVRRRRRRTAAGAAATNAEPAPVSEAIEPPGSSDIEGTGER